MRRNIILYLFIFSLLINVFTYIYFSEQHKYEIRRNEVLEKRVTTLKDSVTTNELQLESANYFALENNQNAKNYYNGQDIEQIKIKVRDGIYAKNAEPNGNPLVQYPPMNDKPFTIDNIKVLNHRWVIADFTNGNINGEVILKYFVEDNGDITFETAETLLYPLTAN